MVWGCVTIDERRDFFFSLVSGFSEISSLAKMGRGEAGTTRPPTKARTEVVDCKPIPVFGSAMAVGTPPMPRRKQNGLQARATSDHVPRTRREGFPIWVR